MAGWICVFFVSLDGHVVIGAWFNECMEPASKFMNMIPGVCEKIILN